MKKTQAETTKSDNLEARFDRGDEVLDYFEAKEAKALHPRRTAGATCIVEGPAEQIVREDTGTYLEESFGKGSRKGAVAAHTQNPQIGDYTKRHETPGSPKKKGQFMDVKSDGKPFKGVAKEPDKRRR